VNQFLQKQRAHKQLISDERCGIKSMRCATEQKKTTTIFLTNFKNNH
jgi:hypothetical protein